MKTFPWARAMEIGLGHLRLAPQDFWRLTLPELSAAARAIGLGSRRETITREDLAMLSLKFPDR